MATHVYGTPCDVEALGELASTNGLRLFFDAAHAFGSERQGIRVGSFGDAEVFSLSPTKVVVAGEGGFVATNDDLLAERIRIGRDYGNPGDYDCRFVGLNARMSEVHAAIALASLVGLDERIKERNRIARWYRAALSGIPGLGFPIVTQGDLSTYKDFTVLVDGSGFGLDADELGRSLAARGIETKRYYRPPVHAMGAYRALGGRHCNLEVTDQASRNALTLPLWSGMTGRDVDQVTSAIRATRLSRSEGRPA
jgi:dTDP-4-amino-4,6-dideoxygalactose transaminase